MGLFLAAAAAAAAVCLWGNAVAYFGVIWNLMRDLCGCTIQLVSFLLLLFFV